jgi:hypothetical protein
VSLDGSRLEVLELKRMVRRMGGESTFADVFSVYEEQLARADKELQTLR